MSTNECIALGIQNQTVMNTRESLSHINTTRFHSKISYCNGVEITMYVVVNEFYILSIAGRPRINPLEEEEQGLHSLNLQDDS